MKYNLVILFAIVMLLIEISAVPTIKKRSTLSENTEVFTDLKSQKKSLEKDVVEEEKEDNSGSYYEVM
ncbi:hypothetical protein INT46_011459 [Mucor plumbeus]|uniref:Uncharacterized protein n=1 Tax=Mucor plumbeus TaxID=97098 RepID=A0A8H7V3R5_9FUNG|nr:hypothetical protein INT46_011459 [Mucor plumbeus]